MLLYTDGGDTRSAMRFSELLDLLKASDVTVYVIGVLEHQTQASKGAQRPVLQQIAEATGGQVFFPLSVRNLDSVYEKVLAEIRAQYTVGYVSTNDKAGRHLAEDRAQGEPQGRPRLPRPRPQGLLRASTESRESGHLVIWLSGH